MIPTLAMSPVTESECRRRARVSDAEALTRAYAVLQDEELYVLLRRRDELQVELCCPTDS